MTTDSCPHGFICLIETYVNRGIVSEMMDILSTYWPSVSRSSKGTEIPGDPSPSSSLLNVHKADKHTDKWKINFFTFKVL